MSLDFLGSLIQFDVKSALFPGKSMQLIKGYVIALDGHVPDLPTDWCPSTMTRHLGRSESVPSPSRFTNLCVSFECCCCCCLGGDELDDRGGDDAILGRRLNNSGLVFVLRADPDE